MEEVALAGKVTRRRLRWDRKKEEAGVAEKDFSGDEEKRVVTPVREAGGGGMPMICEGGFGRVFAKRTPHASHSEKRGGHI